MEDGEVSDSDSESGMVASVIPDHAVIFFSSNKMAIFMYSSVGATSNKVLIWKLGPLILFLDHKGNNRFLQRSGCWEK